MNKRNEKLLDGFRLALKNPLNFGADSGFFLSLSLASLVIFSEYCICLVRKFRHTVLYSSC